ncbi:hypothetical protein OUZ56_004691 [Daphnia magna]|uniref:Uncharacterized protein n=1 Tax=Daphnia magna TaxID=35525 RepID=A0ABQ9YQJ5_9CRUS|nr:hypothetical protein OUZ56_004691 [Daphnia magna]
MQLEAPLHRLTALPACECSRCSCRSRSAQLRKKKCLVNCWTHRFGATVDQGTQGNYAQFSSKPEMEFQSDAKWIMFEKIWMIRALVGHQGCCFASIDSRLEKHSACANFKLNSKKTWNE